MALTAGTIAGSSLLRGGTEANLQLLKNELEGLLADAGCDPASPNGALVLIASDFHVFLGDKYPNLRTEKWDDQLIKEMNYLSPPTTDLVIAGDLITYHSMTPGMPRYASNEQWADQEYDVAKSEIQRFAILPKIIPGNHDTDAFEEDADLFRAKIGVEPYQHFDLAGVSVFMLNTGNAGMLDKVQEEWFRDRASMVAPGQEVLIIQHIPTFRGVYTQAGSKRIIADVFRGRTDPVYVVSGHHHRFSDEIFEFSGTKFVQMVTTTANRVVFNDKKNPGYILLGIQDGRIRVRIQRSLTVDCFWLRPNVETMPVTRGRYPFDDVTERIAFFEEGFYEREGILEYSGSDVGCYIAYCKWAVVKIRTGDYYGKIRKFILSGFISKGFQPTCWISESGEDETWSELPFPEAKGSGLYEVFVPDRYGEGEEFHIKFDTGLSGGTQGFSLSGWAIASDSISLSGYEKWLLSIYGILEKNEKTSPAGIVKNGVYGNLETYAYNLPPHEIGGISGFPEIGLGVSMGREDLVIVRYVRIKDPAGSGLLYRVQFSRDLLNWEYVSSGFAGETIIANDEFYERVEAKVLIPEGTMHGAFRVRVEHVGLQ